LIIGLTLVFIKIGKNKSRAAKTGYGERPVLSIAGLGLTGKISLAAIIIIFSISFFTSSWTGLSINHKRVVFGFQESYGFYKEEIIDGSAFRWSAMDASEIIENNRGSIIVPIKDSDPKDKKFPLFIRFFINNRFVKIVKIDDKEWHDISIDLSGFSGDKLMFSMSCSRSWTPKERGLSNDTRELGVMVGQFRFNE
jgi:hypothetical protein